MSTTKTNALASISTKTLGFTAKENRKLTEDKGAERVFLCRLGGVVIEAFHGESKNGPWVGFKGLFTAMKADKSVYQSTIAFLPGNISKQISDRLSNGEVEIQFSADLFITESDKSGVGFSYICEPILSDEAQKKSESIMKRLLGTALPGVAQLEDKTASAPKKKSA